MNVPSVPVSKQVTAAHEDQLARHAAGAGAAMVGRPGTVIGAGDAGYAEALAGAKVAAPVALKRFSIELRYGPQMMSACAEISATSIDTIMATIMEQGGLRLTSKLPTSIPAGTSFQKGAFIFTQSIHSVVIIDELK